MSDLRQAAQQALEAWGDLPWYQQPTAVYPQMDALRSALAQEQAEPAAWMVGSDLYGHYDCIPAHLLPPAQQPLPLYAAPPQRKPLTDEEIDAEWQKASECAYSSEAVVTTSQFVRLFTRAVERAHGIGDSK